VNCPATVVESFDGVAELAIQARPGVVVCRLPAAVSFGEIALQAQENGAESVLFVQKTNEAPWNSFDAGEHGVQVTIPVHMVPWNVGSKLIDALKADPLTTVTLKSGCIPSLQTAPNPHTAEWCCVLPGTLWVGRIQRMITLMSQCPSPPPFREAHVLFSVLLVVRGGGALVGWVLGGTRHATPDAHAAEHARSAEQCCASSIASMGGCITVGVV
jgi:hypothetical protein